MTRLDYKRYLWDEEVLAVCPGLLGEVGRASGASTLGKDLLLPDSNEIQ